MMAYVTISQPPKKPLRFCDVRGSHNKAGGEWRCGRKGHQESLQDKEKLWADERAGGPSWRKSWIYGECSTHKVFFPLHWDSFGKVKIRIICECRLSHIYIYIYTHKFHIQSITKAMTGLLQRGWTPLSLCHRYKCRKLVLKWHPDKHPEGWGLFHQWIMWLWGQMMKMMQDYRSWERHNYYRFQSV